MTSTKAEIEVEAGKLDNNLMLWLMVSCFHAFHYQLNCLLWSRIFSSNQSFAKLCRRFYFRGQRFNHEDVWQITETNQLRSSRYLSIHLYLQSDRKSRRKSVLYLNRDFTLVIANWPRTFIFVQRKWWILLDLTILSNLIRFITCINKHTIWSIVFMII